MEHDTEASSPDCSQYSECSDTDQFYEDDENTADQADEFANDENNSESSEQASKEQARIQHRTCVVKEILSVKQIKYFIYIFKHFL